MDMTNQYKEWLKIDVEQMEPIEVTVGDSSHEATYTGNEKEETKAFILAKCSGCCNHHGREFGNIEPRRSEPGFPNSIRARDFILL
jgi:hypothetical protein